MFVFAYVAVGICDAAEYHLKEKDPSAIILDEFVAIPFLFIGLNAYNPNVVELNAWPIYIGGFLLLGFLTYLSLLALPVYRN